MVEPSVSVQTMTFSDGQSINFGRGDIVVIVGANNSGKSEVLRNVRDKLFDPNTRGVVATQVDFLRDGTAEDVLEWVRRTSREQGPPNAPVGNPIFSRGSASANANAIRSWWSNPVQGMRELSKFFCHHLSADERLQVANPPANIALTRDPLIHPIHFLQAYDNIETAVSARFHDAFNMDLALQRNLSSTSYPFRGSSSI